MEHAQDQPSHDEINLVRLLRRLEKSAANRDEWKPTVALPEQEVWLKVQKTMQKAKHARGLIKTVEIECEDTPRRIKRLKDAKIQLDRLDSFLKEIEQSSRPKAPPRESLLAKLPLPRPPTPAQETGAPPEISLEDGNEPLSPSLDLAITEKPISLGKPVSSKKSLFITPPDPEAVTSSVIDTALPSLLPLNPSETARASAFSRSFGPTPISRNIASAAAASTSTTNTAATGNQATTALHEELSSQLEQMAQQLKRNAIHFSTSLAKDKTVIEAAAEKIESNYDTMQTQRVKLRDRSSSSRSNTCMTLGIILLVLLVFLFMVSVIRFTR
ncbi:hypothetical protein CPB83DRAFT_857134 [Crepidotus variabilis]|uniref:USE1-like protein n=1 Tax=Crepidotus variabilis TaxID=179855 RepID=A0A9P6ECE8_9AGAR|nr:hypothetical protein CPB83DRAFT_857134 [Crepidotus variabilis]